MRSSRWWGVPLKARIREALYIGLFDALPLLRDPMLLVVISLFSFLPVIFIFVFATQPGAAEQSLVGAIILIFSFTGLFASQSVYFNKQWFRFQDMFVASRVSPASYAFGLSLSGLVVALPSVVVALIFLIVSGPTSALGILLLLATSALLWIGLVFVGFAIGASTKNARRANSVPQVLSIAMGFLPPVYYPLAFLDKWPIAQAFAMAIPTTHAAQLAKYYFGLLPNVPDWQIVVGWVYLLAFAAVMGVIAARRAHWVDP
jgi:ABC-type multidrug transport system permease subunit